MIDGGLSVLARSAHELVVWKPPGLASELRDPQADSVLRRVARMLPGAEPRLPHRLDRVTRGIVLVCLSPDSIAFHNAQIQARRWDKVYLARVAALPGHAPESFLGEHRAFLDERKGRAQVVRAGGKPALLHLVAAAPVPERADRWHLVIRLITGRFHQIRVMCAALGLPLAGDPLYDPAQRDPGEFYLEHSILKYEAFDDRCVSTCFLPSREDRGALAPAIEARLVELAAGKASFEP